MKALSRRGLARVQLGEYAQGEKDVIRALELLPADDLVERERIKIILMKAKKGLQEQKKAVEKRKASMRKGFTSKEGGIGDSRVKADTKPRKARPSAVSLKYLAPSIVLGSVFVAMISVTYYLFVM